MVSQRCTGGGGVVVGEGCCFAHAVCGAPGWLPAGCLGAGCCWWQQGQVAGGVKKRGGGGEGSPWWRHQVMVLVMAIGSVEAVQNNSFEPGHTLWCGPGGGWWR